MKSNITKIAAAVVVIIAVIVGVNRFGGSISITAIAFADINEAMKNVPWLYMESRGSERGITGVGEQWIGLESKIHASKYADGKVTVINLNEHKSYKYDPENHTITIDNFNEDYYPLNLSSPVELLESMFKMAKEQGAQFTTSQAKYNGQKVQLQEIIFSGAGPNRDESQHARLYIQADRKLLLAAKVEGKDSKGNITMNGEITFSYPSKGPSDIYDLGVPKDTKIINNISGRK